MTTKITGADDSIAPTNERLAAENADMLKHYKVTQDWRSTFSGWLSREAPSTSERTWVQRKSGGW